jgi:RNA polymerase sigma-70 factor (ECF subfamily)
MPAKPSITEQVVTDREIISRILAGEQRYYQVLVERYQSLVFRTCLGFVHHKEDADDLTQDVFIQAYQSLKNFKGQASFSTWLYRIAVNASLNKVRKSSKFDFLKRFDTLFSSGKEADKTYPDRYARDPEEILLQTEQAEWVQKALDSLPAKQRTAIVLSKYDDLPQKEIAKVMNISEGAVEALLQRARTNLKEKLVNDYKKIKNDHRKK